MGTSPRRALSAPAPSRRPTGNVTPADLDLLACPQCATTAEVEWRAVVGGVPHVKLRCVNRHWFLMPDEGLQRV